MLFEDLFTFVMNEMFGCRRWRRRRFEKGKEPTKSIEPGAWSNHQRWFRCRMSHQMGQMIDRGSQVLDLLVDTDLWGIFSRIVTRVDKCERLSVRSIVGVLYDRLLLFIFIENRIVLVNLWVDTFNDSSDEDVSATISSSSSLDRDVVDAVDEDEVERWSMES